MRLSPASPGDFVDTRSEILSSSGARGGGNDTASFQFTSTSNGGARRAGLERSKQNVGEPQSGRRALCLIAASIFRRSFANLALNSVKNSTTLVSGVVPGSTVVRDANGAKAR